jgi:hypothetical protein
VISGNNWDVLEKKMNSSPSGGPSPFAETRLLSFNRTQSTVIFGLLTGHNTLRRHLHLMGLNYSPLCRKCGAEEETSAHILCEYEALASLGHICLGSFFLDPEFIKILSLEAIWNFSKGKGLPGTDIITWEKNYPFN